MSAKNLKPLSKQQLIIELWDRLERVSVGAPELDLIQQGLLKRLGADGSESPASIARTLTDQGVPLRHPEILAADAKWRQDRMSALFSPEELNLVTMEAASEWVERLDSLYRKFEGEQAVAGLRLRQLVLRIKSELELRAASAYASEKDRQLAQELAQWLTVWLQNPQIFGDWLALRRSTAEFQERFSS